MFNPKFKYIGISSTDDAPDKNRENRNDANNEYAGNINNLKKYPFCAYFSFK